MPKKKKAAKRPAAKKKVVKRKKSKAALRKQAAALAKKPTVEVKRQDANDIWRMMESLVVEGNLASLSSQERCLYYQAVCESLNLNPLTRPFEYIELNSKLVLYATATCADQLRAANAISIVKIVDESDEQFFRMRAYGEQPSGRKDTAVAIVFKEGSGTNLANLYMKAETKAKRRLTLSMSGLNIVDESDLDTLKGMAFAKVKVNGDIESIGAVQAVKGDADIFVTFKDEIEKLHAKDAELRPMFNAAMSELKWSKDQLVGICLNHSWNHEPIKHFIGNKLEEAAANRASVVKP